ncbi:UNC93-like protein [Lachnellula suecica]|uniref:UNC93-like protein n=1 Tax=Lachnellula suecica TaxID=602035 RepID=A0A8T9CK05_9HELO|nr:UNC93-like protein [Lachnellula suecica]
MSDTEGKHKVRWYRSTLYCAFLVSIVGFLGPGMYNALNGLGAGGGVHPDISNAANAIIYGIISSSSYFVAALANRITPKYTLLIGTLGSTPYAAGLYCNDRYGTNWLLLFGSVLSGFTSTFLWVGTGSILLAYTEEKRKGTAVSLKFAMGSIGACVGDAISLALNVERNYRGSVSNATYITLMTLISLGFPFALLMPTAKRVERTDGRAVVLHKQASIAKEFRVLKGIFSQARIWALIPLIIYSLWWVSYVWGYNYENFNVRTRALNSFLFAICGLISALSMGQLLDNPRWKRRTRARVGFVVVTILTSLGWILALAVQVHYTKTKPTIDWTDKAYGVGGLVQCLFGFNYPLVTVYLYWLVGSFSNDLNETTFLAATLNGVACLGSTFGFVISVKEFSAVGACAIILALYLISVPPAAWVAFTQVAETTHGIHLSGDANFEGSEAEDARERSIDDNSDELKGSSMVAVAEKSV